MYDLSILSHQFFNHGFKFQNCVFNDCHDLMLLCLNLSDNDIIIVKNVDYHCVLYEISKSGAIQLLGYYVIGHLGYIENAYWH